MPSGWEVYYIVFLSGLMSWVIPFSLRILAPLFRQKGQNRGTQKLSPYREKIHTQMTDQAPRNLSQLGSAMNPRFFIAVNSGLIFMTISFLLIPVVGVLQPGTPKEELALGVVLILSIALFSALALFYSNRKRDLSWLRSERLDRRRK